MPQLVPIFFMYEGLFDIFSYNLFIATLSKIFNIDYYKLLLIRLKQWRICIVLMKGKISHPDFTSDVDNKDMDKTPSNEKVNQDGSTPTEALSDAKETLQTVEQALNGEHVDETSLDNIKEEFQSIFDEHKI